MLRFDHSFPVPASPDESFALLADPARVAPCLPGAVLTGDPPAGALSQGDELSGRMGVRLGPVSTEFDGVVRVLELDRSERRTVLGVRADDERGNGSAEATITLSVEPADGGAIVRAGTELEIRGRIATFGAGAVQRVSERVLDRFAANLAGLLGGGEPAAAGAPATPAAAGGSASALGLRDLVPAPAGAAWPLLATLWAFLCGVLVGRSVRSR